MEKKPNPSTHSLRLLSLMGRHYISQESCSEHNDYLGEVLPQKYLIRDDGQAAGLPPPGDIAFHSRSGILPDLS